MKVLIINQHRADALGGSEIQCDLIAKYMTEFGHEVCYFAVEGRSTNYDVPYEVTTGKLNQENIRQILDKVKPDVIYWRYNKRRFYSSARLLNQSDAKLLFSIANTTDVNKWKHWNNLSISSLRDLLLIPYTLFFKSIKHRYNHFGYWYVDAVISLNPDFLDDVNVTPKKTIFNSMETNIVPFDWPRDYVIWVSNLKSKKNPDIFVKLSKEFTDSDVDFLMVGDIFDEEYEYIRSDKKTPDVFHYLGSKTPEEVNGIIKESLFFVRTDNVSGFGNTFIQSWLMGKPTVTLHKGTGKFIKENGIGYVSGDFQTFCKDVQRLILEDQVRNEMGKRAKEFAESHFDPESNMRELESFMYQLSK